MGQSQPKTAPRALAPRWVGAAVLAGGLALTFVGSSVVGPAFDEDRRVLAVQHASDLVRAVGDFGPGAFVSSSGRGVYDDLAPFGVALGIVSGWLGRVLQQSNALDPLTATRFGFLLLTGLAPWALFQLVRMSVGPVVALVASLLLVAMPRFAYGACAAREPVIVASAWLLVLAAYVRALRPTRGTAPAERIVPPVLFALALGLGAATNLATLWVVPLLVVHYLAVHPRTSWRSLRRGIAPLPAGILWALVLAPGVVFAASPQLLRGGATTIADFVLAPLAPSVEKVEYLGKIVSDRSIPPLYAPHFLLFTIPVMTLAFAVGGAFVLGQHARFRLRQGLPGDPYGLGLLCLLGVLAVLFGPAFTPRVLTRFPPRTELALPFVAVLAAVGLTRAATLVVETRRAPFTAVASAVIALAVCASGLPTAAASFNVLAGGTQGVLASHVFAVGDGSEVAPIARPIDALRLEQVGIQASDLPRAYLLLLHSKQRLRTEVTPARGAPGELTLARGARNGAIATVERRGAVLYSLTRR